MELEEFVKEFRKLSIEANISVDEYKIKKFYAYMKLIQDWNEKINLTTILEPKEMIIKHFIDSLTISKRIKDDSRVIDIGTGAGFPGIPLKIVNESINITLVDSLNKRIIFLNDVVEKLELKNVEILHGRAEDFAQDSKYREKYDYVISRAVAPLNILSEYLIPYASINGEIIAMKGDNALEEIKNSQNALKQLNSYIVEEEKIELPEHVGNRYIILIKKRSKTSMKYPRKAGIPKKNPL